MEIKLIILFVKVTHYKARDSVNNRLCIKCPQLIFDPVINVNNGVFVLEDTSEGMCVYLEEEQEDNSNAMCNRKRRTQDRREESEKSRGRNYQNRF